MSIFSKVNFLFLSVAVVFTTFGQLQTSSGTPRILPHSEESETSVYSEISNRNLWGVIDSNISSSLLNFYLESDFEEDRKGSSDSDSKRQSALERISFLYLSIAKKIELSPTIGELLYPFYFYF